MRGGRKAKGAKEWNGDYLRGSGTQRTSKDLKENRCSDHFNNKTKGDLQQA